MSSGISSKSGANTILATAREFHSLYGEFFSVWKLWNYAVRDMEAIASPGAARWELLKRACDAEGRFEALLVRLSCDRRLDVGSVEVLGRYRQLYQCLRQAIRDGEPLRWDSSDHPDHQAFKKLAPEIATLIVIEDPLGLPPAQAANAFRSITSNQWERRSVESTVRSSSGKPLMGEVTMPSFVLRTQADAESSHSD